MIRIIAALLTPFICYLVFGFVTADFNAWNWTIDGVFYCIVVPIVVLAILSYPKV